MKKVIFVISFTQLLCITYGQVLQQWTARYNAPANNGDVAFSIAVDSNGYVYVTGYTTNTIGTNHDYLTIKYNSDGILQWERSYNGPGDRIDYARVVAADNAGNVYVTGYSMSGYAYGTEDFATIKYDSAGNVLWISRYNGPANLDENPNAMVIDLNGNVYVSGSSNGGNESYDDYCIVKYNSAGVQQWAAVYNGTGNEIDRGHSLAVDLSGNVYITGISTGSGTLTDVCTIKYNSSGIQQWAARYNGPLNQNDEGVDMAIDASGNVYVTGNRMDANNYSTQDFVTIKYSPSGIQQWVAVYNGPANDWDFVSSIDLDQEGNIYVAGSSRGSGTDFDYATLKYNSSGVQQWVSRYAGSATYGLDNNNALTTDESGNVYVTGASWGSDNNFDYLTLKYNTNGIQQWVMRYNGSGNGSDAANSIAIDHFGNVYVTGQSYGRGSNFDYLTIKYSQTVGINPLSSEIPGGYSLSQNYPNPFNPTTKIGFDIPSVGAQHIEPVQLIIYDILGKEVVTMVNEQLNPGTYEVEWEASNYPSGIYYYKIAAGDFSETKKMILIK